jgi:hypothetical protein
MPGWFFDIRIQNKSVSKREKTKALCVALVPLARGVSKARRDGLKFTETRFPCQKEEPGESEIQLS